MPGTDGRVTNTRCNGCKRMGNIKKFCPEEKKKTQGALLTAPEPNNGLSRYEASRRG